MDTSYFSPSLATTWVFASTLITGLLLKLYLASRQIRHVANHRSRVPTAFAGRISLHDHQKAADYSLAKSRLELIDLGFGLAVLLGWTLLGGLSALNQVLIGLISAGMWQQIALVTCFVAINAAMDMPMTLYKTFVLEERFGFNKMTWRLWLTDSIRGAGVGALVGLPVLALVLWVMQASGALWWIWAWCVWAGLSLALMVIYPSVIAPLFNKFEPLQDESIKARVKQLMDRCGFSAKGLFVMDGSKRSSHANAYFTGFGAAKRVVFFDTLLSKLSAAELDAVLAHELGHFKHKHIANRLVMMFATSLVGLAVLGWLSTQVWFYTGLGVQPNFYGTPNDALALLLFMMCAPAFTFFLSPIFARLSRAQEFEADAYAIAQTNGADLASALVKLYQDNASTLTPDPMFVKFYYSHPPATERLSCMGLPDHVLNGVHG